MSDDVIEPIPSELALTAKVFDAIRTKREVLAAKVIQVQEDQKQLGDSFASLLTTFGELKAASTAHGSLPFAFMVLTEYDAQGNAALFSGLKFGFGVLGDDSSILMPFRTARPYVGAIPAAWTVHFETYLTSALAATVKQNGGVQRYEDNRFWYDFVGGKESQIAESITDYISSIADNATIANDPVPPNIPELDAVVTNLDANTARLTSAVTEIVPIPVPPAPTPTPDPILDPVDPPKP